MKRRLVGLLLLPVLTLIFVIGWTMYFLGDEKEQGKLKQRTLVFETKSIVLEDAI